MGGQASNLAFSSPDSYMPRSRNLHVLALLAQQHFMVAGMGSSSSNTVADNICSQDSALGQRRVAVVGASLGGLAAANVFAQLPGFAVDVYERAASSFEDKGSGLGFVDVGLWQELRGVRMMRRGVQASRAQGAFFYGDLWKFLYQGLPSDTVHFGQRVENLGSNPSERPVIAGKEYDLVVAADGGWSGLRPLVTSSMPVYAGYVVYRGMVDADLVPGFRAFGVFKNGIYDLIALPLTTDAGRDCIVCA
eukprot:2581115-Rhodomonas_salina.2